MTDATIRYSDMKTKFKTERPEKPTWEFLYEDANDPVGGKLHHRYYRAPSITQAATKMLRWLKSQDAIGNEWKVDYEARACHLPHTAPHKEYYPNLSELDHPIREYV